MNYEPSLGSSRTRHDFNVNIENYVKAIWTLSQQKERADEPVKNSEIASYLRITRPSVTDMLRKLESKKLLKSEGGRSGVKLTPGGKRLAVEVLRKHRLIEMFLHKTLDFKGMELHEEAELLEHAMSSRLMERIDAYLGNPAQDLSGMAIPDAGDLHHRDFEAGARTLMHLESGQSGEIVSLADYDLPSLNRCYEQGLKVGLKFKVVDKVDEDFVQIQTKNGILLTLGSRQASLVKVKRS
ncbi:MAG: metal-dependent transcriptional regulator [Bdellovibrionota bacterium]